VGVSGGATNYQGDLGSSINVLSTRPGFGLDFKYYLNPFLSARVGLMHGWVSAADSLASNEARLRRNLSFRSPVTEANLVVILDLNPKGGRFKDRPHFVPYLFTGIAFFRFNPQARLGNQWVDLQPLGTEGQHLGDLAYPSPYERYGVAIPMGLGLRFKLSPSLDLELETSFKRTFTDYLDDVSGQYVDAADVDRLDLQAQVLHDRIDQEIYPEGAKVVNGKRGDANSLDWYIYTCIRLNYNINTEGYY